MVAAAASRASEMTEIAEKARARERERERERERIGKGRKMYLIGRVTEQKESGDARWSCGVNGGRKKRSYLVDASEMTGFRGGGKEKGWRDRGKENRSMP